mgnify:CR=1 FL=1
MPTYRLYSFDELKFITKSSSDISYAFYVESTDDGTTIKKNDGTATAATDADLYSYLSRFASYNKLKLTSLKMDTSLTVASAAGTTSYIFLSNGHIQNSDTSEILNFSINDALSTSERMVCFGTITWSKTLNCNLFK